MDEGDRHDPVAVIPFPAGARVKISGLKKRADLNGKLGYVSMEIDLNNRHRVWVEIQNQPIIDEATGKVIDWQIKPGMRASIKIPQGS